MGRKRSPKEEHPFKRLARKAVDLASKPKREWTPEDLSDAIAIRVFRIGVEDA